MSPNSLIKMMYVVFLYSNLEAHQVYTFRDRYSASLSAGEDFSNKHLSLKQRTGNSNICRLGLIMLGEVIILTEVFKLYLYPYHVMLQLFS